MNNARLNLLGGLVLLLGIGPGRVGAQGATPTEGGVVVHVEDAVTHRALPDSRVFILSDSGTELASAKSNADGQAVLPEIPKGAAARYVLVETSGYFIGGLRWLPGLREYHIGLTRVYIY
jgi:hypothetical protein